MSSFCNMQKAIFTISHLPLRGEFRGSPASFFPEKTFYQNRAESAQEVISSGRHAKTKKH